jgi:hypothetical protein
LLKVPITKAERKVQKLLSKHKTALPTDLKHKLTPYHSKSLHLYGLSKIHKPDIPLRPVASSVGSPSYAPAGVMHEILSPFARNSEYFAKNPATFTVVEVCKPSNFRCPN